MYFISESKYFPIHLFTYYKENIHGFKYKHKSKLKNNSNLYNSDIVKSNLKIMIPG